MTKSTIEMFVVCWATFKCWTSHSLTTGVMFKPKMWLTLKLATQVYNQKFLDTHMFDQSPMTTITLFSINPLTLKWVIVQQLEYIGFNLKLKF